MIDRSLDHLFVIEEATLAFEAYDLFEEGFLPKLEGLLLAPSVKR